MKIKMNKYFFLIFFCILYSLVSKAQRYPRIIKINYTLIPPEPFSIYTSDDYIKVNFYFYNHGPDTLQECDSFKYVLEHGRQTNSNKLERYFFLDKTLFPGDTSTIYEDSILVGKPIFQDGSGRLSLYFQLHFGGTVYSPPFCGPAVVNYHKSQEQQWVNNLLYKATFSVDNISKESEMLVYPNPVSNNFLNLQMSNIHNITKIELNDISGRGISFDIKHKGGNSITLDLSGIKSGIYIIKVLNEGIWHYKRIIKNE